MKKIKFLPEEYRTIPKLAITARLFGIKPISSTWNMDDSIQFHRATRGKILQGVVLKTIDNENPDDNLILEMRLIHTTKTSVECINDELVKSGRAIRVKYF